MNNNQGIPPSALVHCCFCGDPLHSGQGGVYHKGTAWFKQNKSQTSGLNSGCLAEWSDEWACQFCIHKVINHIPLNQMELFTMPIYDD